MKTGSKIKKNAIICNLNMENNMKGIWKSETLKEIPNYNSNFTNWVDCICYKGQIKVEILDEGELVLKVHVPVKYYGGIEGYACLNKYSVDKEKMCIRGLNTKSEISKFVLIDENTLIIKNIFDEQRTFNRVK